MTALEGRRILDATRNPRRSLTRAAEAPDAVARLKPLRYGTDALLFEAAIQAGIQTNAISRQTQAFRQGVARFLGKPR